MINGELGLDTYKILGRDLDQGNSTANMFMGDNRGGRGLVKHANTKKKKKKSTGFHAFPPVSLILFTGYTFSFGNIAIFCLNLFDDFLPFLLL